MIAIWFSGSPNQPPWLYKASEQPILRGLPGQWSELRRGRLDPPLLLWSHHAIGAQIQEYPELGLDLMTLERVENDPRFSVELARRDPERIEGDAVPLERFDLGVEGRNVLGAPVVSEVLETRAVRAWPRVPPALVVCYRTARCTRPPDYPERTGSRSPRW